MGVCVLTEDPSDRVYVASSTPTALYSFKLHDDKVDMTELYQFFPVLDWKQRIELSVVGLQNELSGQVLVHEAVVRRGLICFTVCY